MKILQIFLDISDTQEEASKSQNITELGFINIDEPEIHHPVSGQHYDQVCL
jgi:hypothetical protein